MRWDRCIVCGMPQITNLVEATAWGDPFPVYLDGTWEPCAHCGSSGQPVRVAGDDVTEQNRDRWDLAWDEWW